MDKQAQHTPGPWTFCAWPGNVAKIAIGPERMGYGERPVAYTSGRAAGTKKGQSRAGAEPAAVDVANAEFIVRACNAYDELLEALDKIVKYADSEPDGGETVEMHRANVERARAALAKARGDA